MAYKWRIRHKLMLGMVLVMAVMGLLLAGALKGLASYSATMRTIDSKIVELNAAEELRATIKDIDSQAKINDLPNKAQLYDLPNKARAAEKALDDYHVKLLASVSGSRDSYQGYKEKEQVNALKEGFRKLYSALDLGFSPQVSSGADQSDPPREAIRQALAELFAASSGLHLLIEDDVHHRVRLSQAEYKLIFGIVMATSVVTVLLMAGLLRFFYGSVAHPIRDLERGVGRVAKGDFDYRIDVRSGDEIEDLAKAFNDMTTRLRDMYRDLAHQVNERSRQLVRSERLAGVGFLAAGVAHEINNPLASIAFCGEALERRLADLFDARRAAGNAGNAGDAQEREIVSKYLKMIQDEAFRCKTITRKLLEFSRGGERRREQTNLGELIQIVLDMVQHLPSAKGKQVDFEHSEKIIIWINGQEIQQVFLNLVINALESMEEGGQLTINQRRKDAMVEIVFKDTGCGMTGEVLENIFEPFFTRSRTGKGTGLGLSITHRIITQHGGEIEAASGGANQGSTFTVRLPLEAPAVQQEGDMEVLDPETEFLKLRGARRERVAA